MEVPQITLMTLVRIQYVSIFPWVWQDDSGPSCLGFPLHGNSLERDFFFNPDSQKVRYLSLKKEEETVKSRWVLYRGRKF